ncbi:MAG: alpha/beta hydrolase family protein [Oceanicaulis sp.]
MRLGRTAALGGLLAAPLLLAACASDPVSDPYADQRPISWRNLLEREREAADHRIAYGAGEERYGELWLPAGHGPHPLVIMIHGGCWRAEIPGTILQDQLNADLRRRGFAVWNLTYPRVGHGTGGYPGTFAAVAGAVDHARTLAGTYPLDLSRTVIVGHSAGGHLALWSAARRRLPADAPGAGLDPVKPRAVISLAGLNDLEDYAANGPGRCGEPEIVAALVGEGRADPYADTSPARLLPLGVPQVIVSGALDPIVPPALGAAYAARAEAAGDAVTLIEIEDAGHFELIDPTAPAWRVVLAEIERATR